VDGARVRLYATATNEPVVHPQVIYEHGEPRWNDIDRGKLLISPAYLSGNPNSSHLVAGGGTGERNDEALRSIFVNTSQVIFYSP
jgi:hypothetical protein